MKIREKILYALVLLLFVSSMQLYGQNRIARSAESLLVDAVSLFNEEQYTDARPLLSLITDLDPDNDAAYYYLALCDYFTGNSKDAVAELKEAVRLDPGNYWYRDRLALIYSLTGQEASAISVYEDLLKDFPKKTEIYYSLVNLYAQKNDADKVLETLDAIETVAGKSEGSVSARFDVLMRLNRRDEAFKALSDFNEEYSSAQILAMMGDFKMNEYEDSLALKYYEEALSYQSDYAPAMLGRAEAYRLSRSYDKFFESIGDFVRTDIISPQAKTQYLSSFFQHSDDRFLRNWQPQLDSLMEDCVTTHPKDTSVLSLAGSYYYTTQRIDRAKELFKANTDNHPDNFIAAATYIQMLGTVGDWQGLRDESEVAFSRFPDEPGFLQMKSMAEYNLHDFKAVVEDNQRVIELFPKDSAAVLSAYSSIGDIYHMVGHPKEAFKVYDKALKINPTYAPVLNNYAYYLSLTGRKLKKAYAMSKITVDQEPDNATYLDTLGWILYLQGKAEDAKAYFKHAMLYGGKDSVTILDHYAEVLYKLEEYDLATVYWNMAKQKNTEGEIPDLDERVQARLDAIKK